MTPTHTPGWKSTEFWLTFAVTLSSALTAIFNDSEIVRTTAAVMGALSAAFYAQKRTDIKIANTITDKP